MAGVRAQSGPFDGSPETVTGGCFEVLSRRSAASRARKNATAGPFPVAVLMTPSGLAIAVTTKAIPATIVWYLPTLNC